MTGIPGWWLRLTPRGRMCTFEILNCEQCCRNTAAKMDEMHFKQHQKKSIIYGWFNLSWMTINKAMQITDLLRSNDSRPAWIDLYFTNTNKQAVVFQAVAGSEGTGMIEHSQNKTACQTVTHVSITASAKHWELQSLWRSSRLHQVNNSIFKPSLSKEQFVCRTCMCEFCFNIL